jgi:hypothetical protein
VTTVNKSEQSDGSLGQMKSAAAKPYDAVAAKGRIVNQQLSLFVPETMGPAGLRYYPEIITPSVELDLIERIRGLALAPFQFGAFEGKRPSHRSASNTTTQRGGFRKPRKCRNGWRR